MTESDFYGTKWEVEYGDNGKATLYIDNDGRVEYDADWDDNSFFIADDKGRYPLSVSNRYSFYAEQGILPKSLPKSKTKSNKFRR